VVTGLVPGVSEGGLKAAVAPSGRPETLNVTAFAKPFALLGATVMGIEPELPAVTVREAGPLSAKSSTAKLTAAEGPPPGGTLLTVTVGAAIEETSLAEIVAVNCVELTNVVGSGLPPNFTSELARKFAPLTVSVNAAPAGAFVGEIEEMLGTGLTIGADASAESGPSPAIVVADTT
jgi:hypothetical protein